MSQRPSLSPKQAQYVALTCQGQPNTEIAKALGVDRKTITRWSKLPQIQSAIAEGNSGAQRGIGQAQEESYRQLAKTTTQQTMELVEKYTPAAIKTVVLILGKNDAKDSDKLRAAELLTKWAGIGQVANQPQQSAEQNFHLYVAALEKQTNAN